MSPRYTLVRRADGVPAATVVPVPAAVTATTDPTATVWPASNSNGARNLQAAAGGAVDPTPTATLGASTAASGAALSTPAVLALAVVVPAVVIGLVALGVTVARRNKQRRAADTTAPPASPGTPASANPPSLPRSVRSNLSTSTKSSKLSTGRWHTVARSIRTLLGQRSADDENNGTVPRTGSTTPTSPGARAAPSPTFLASVDRALKRSTLESVQSVTWAPAWAPSASDVGLTPRVVVPDTPSAPKATLAVPRRALTVRNVRSTWGDGASCVSSSTVTTATTATTAYEVTAGTAKRVSAAATNPRTSLWSVAGLTDATQGTIQRPDSMMPAWVDPDVDTDRALALWPPAAGPAPTRGAPPPPGGAPPKGEPGNRPIFYGLSGVFPKD
ncbi:hypothetical protein AMAG_06082 [Allomyces macrogynus ATCC 38327]|uniref:Uncharacterized protein n=1 Tax=Allomyces macrogynus (strain ATCC 38327) TaxID=578462 RepID=A0A0L0SE60_ALLM3|nr:hypothetical protein AMAG_06082 [Allomyces macrogynus ATCC 38327]|eukprot:KNE60719.1 hypothetical protein AMAG_06082 [Allomyces macrogynus ATCC 38327]